LICGREIPFEDAAVDHIIPHSKGGITSLANGRIAHKSCNIARGNRETFRPDVDCKLLLSEVTAESEAGGSEFTALHFLEGKTSQPE